MPFVPECSIGVPFKFIIWENFWTALIVKCFYFVCKPKYFFSVFFCRDSFLCAVLQNQNDLVFFMLDCPVNSVGTAYHIDMIQ